MKEVLQQAQALQQELVELRRHFHRYPELSGQEFETAKFVAGYLSQLGVEQVRPIGKTGVTGLICGGLPGDVTALRADMDALPILEQNGCDYRSQNEGRMHACGHDAHITCLLGAAKLLVANRERLPGTVKLIFQPAEEISTGAMELIHAGILDNPKVDRILGLHVLPDVDAGKAYVFSGPFTSSMESFKITVKGKGGHGSAPQSAIDPIVTAAQLICALQTVVSRKAAPQNAALLTVGTIQSGTQFNIIPDEAVLTGCIRSLDPVTEQVLHQELIRVSQGVGLAAGAECVVETRKIAELLNNNPAMAADFVRVVRETAGEETVYLANKGVMFSEDFSYYANRIPGLMFGLGVRQPEKGADYPLHNNHFNLDEDVLSLGAGLFASYCLHRGNL